MRQLWQQRDFMKLWGGQTVSLFGSQITVLALPLTAILIIHATPFQVSLLAAALWLPYPLFTLVLGYAVDRLPRRPLLISADLARVALIGSIPLLAWQQMLTMPELYGIAFFIGTFTVLFNLTYGAYLPAVLPREQFIQGNSALQTSQSMAEMGGPSLGGILVQVMTAPFALLIDAGSFLVSALGVFGIRHQEEVPSKEPDAGTFVQHVTQGMRIIANHPALRGIALAAGIYNFFEQFILALWLIFAIRTVHLTPAWIGGILGMGSVGALIGSLSASHVLQRWHFGQVYLCAATLECVALILIPLAFGPEWFVISLLTSAFFLNGVGLAMTNIYARTLRQILIPDHLFGRVLAAYSLIGLGAVPLGAFLAGLLQLSIGIRLTLLCGGLGVIASVGGLWWGRIPHLTAVTTAVPIQSEK